MHLQLSAEQGALLHQLLDEALGDLRMEIADTDNSRYKEQLRGREQTLLSLLDLVRAAA